MATWTSHPVDEIGARGAFCKILSGAGGSDPYPLTITAASSSGKTFKVDGDQSSAFTDAVQFVVGSGEDGAAAGNIGLYTCDGNSSYSGGADETTITVIESIAANETDGRIWLESSGYPQIAYFIFDPSDSSGKLKFASATSKTPTDSDDWEFSVLDELPASISISDVNAGESAFYLSGDYTEYFANGSKFSVFQGVYPGGYICGGAIYNAETGSTKITATLVTGSQLSIIAADTDANSFKVSGNYATSFGGSAGGVNFVVRGSTGNDGFYQSTSASYNSTTDRTTIIVNDVPDTTDDGKISTSTIPGTEFPVIGGAEFTIVDADSEANSFKIDGNAVDTFGGTSGGVGFEVKESADNNGLYVSLNASYNSSEGRTVVFVSSVSSNTPGGTILVGEDSTKLTVAGNQTGTFVPDSEFFIAGSTGNDGEYSTISATWDSQNGVTIIEVAGLPHPTHDGSIFLAADATGVAISLGGTGYDISAVKCNGIPQIAYRTMRHSFLNYMISNSPVPSADYGTQKYSIDDSGPVASALSLGLVEGLPAIAHFSEPDLRLLYSYADGVLPSSSDNWTQVEIAAGIPSSVRGFTPILRDFPLPSIFSAGSGRLWQHESLSGSPDTEDFNLASTTKGAAIIPSAFAPGSGRHASVVDNAPVAVFKDLRTNSPESATGLRYVRPLTRAVDDVDHTAHTIEVVGDFSDEYPAGTWFGVGGSTSNDNLYLVASVAFSGGNTVITVDHSGGPDLVDSTVDGYVYAGSAAGTSDPRTIIEANTGSDYFTIDGDHEDEFPEGQAFVVTGSTGNNGYYEVTSSSYSSGTGLTTINVANVADGTADGIIFATDWHTHTVVADDSIEEVFVGEIDLGSGPLPFLLFTDSDYDSSGTPALKFAISDAAAPSSSANWTISVVNPGGSALETKTGWIDAISDGTTLHVVCYDLLTWDLLYLRATSI